MLSSPGNPLGTVTGSDELKRISQVLEEKVPSINARFVQISDSDFSSFRPVSAALEGSAGFD